MLMKRKALRLMTTLFLVVFSLSLATAQPSSVKAKKAVATSKGMLTARVSPNKGPKAFTPALKRAKSRMNSNNKLFTRNKSFSFSLPMQAKKSPQLAPGYAPEIYAACVYNTAWTEDDAAYGFYSLPTNGSSAYEAVALIPDLDLTSGFYADGKYYCVSAFSFWGYIIVSKYVYDAETWELLSSSDDGEATDVASDFAYDETSGKAYGTFYNSDMSGYNFGYFDPATTTTTVICTSDDLWNGCAIAADGYIYAITSEGKLIKVDKNNGSTTEIGSTGLTPKYLTTAVFDKKSGRYFYLLNNDTESSLYEIDLTTAAATKITSYDNYEEFVGGWIPAPKAEDTAPDTPVGLSANFEAGSLSGTINFTAPSTLFNGEAATGPLTYKLTANDNIVLAEGETEFGAAVSVPVTLEKSGTYKFTVTVANNVGDSPKAKMTYYVGNDVLKPVSNVVLSYDGTNMNLSWNAATETVNGGYFDPAQVRYTVTRYPGAVVVADKQEGTTFSEPMSADELTSFYYTVVASWGDEVSAEAESNKVSLGIIVPPYLNAFDDESSLNGYTDINGSGDDRKWEWYSEAVRYKYDSNNDMDGWLITPAVKLEAGKMYKVSFDARSNSSNWPERIEAKFGTKATAAGMNNVIVEPTILETTDYVTLSNYIIPETSGVYYIGLHAISDANTYYLYADNLSISEGMSTAAPDSVTNLKVVADPSGALSATISFNAPEKTIGGDDLSSITKIEVIRDGNVVKTIDNPAVGAEQTVTDTDMEAGTHVYTVKAYNADGVGLSNSASVYIGLGVPSSPENATIAETANEGEVTISWTAPSTDVNGKPINPSSVTYTILNADGETIVEDLAATTYTFQAVDPANGQDFVYYGIFASNSAGVSEEAAITDMIPVGPAYTTPFAESFAGDLSYIFGYESLVGSTSWSLFDDTSGVSAQDGDNGFLGGQGSSMGDTSRFFSGKVKITSENAALSFWYYGFEDGENTIEVEINDGTGWQKVGDVYTVGPVEGWKKALVDLSAYKGKTIQFAFRTTVQSHSYTLIDNIVLDTPLSYDLKAESINAPKTVVPDQEYNVTVDVSNYGTETASGYSVELYRDGALVSTVAGTDLASGAKTTVSFTDVASITSPESLTYSAKINWTADQNADNNATESVSVKVKQSSYPAVTDLSGSETNDGVELTWSEPSTGNVGQPVTEGFEEFESFAVNPAGDWTFIDGDGYETYTFQGIQFPNSASAMAYIVMDATHEGFEDESFAAHSGDKYMGSFAATTAPNNDWMISPELNGEAQTISFWAKSFTLDYGSESFEILYSTTGKAVEDFTRLEAVDNVPEEWTEYSYDLPAGAKYFAIRCTSNDKFIFLVDDVTYIPANAAQQELALVGYNIYRDGEKINAEPVAETTYIDKTASEGTHTYVVTVVYDKGESKISNEVTIEVTSGINAITGKNVTISSGKNVINVANAEGMNVLVTGADGKTIFEGKGKENATVNVPSGIYVVKVGDTVVKTIVK